MVRKNKQGVVMGFLDLQSVKKLKALADKGCDLRKEGFLTPERISSYQASACGFKLLWGCERVDSEIMTALFALAKESKALDKMKAMQSGEVINTIEGVESENRSVLHTAMRDFFEGRIESDPAKKASDEAKKEFDKLKSFLEKEGSQFDHLIQVGIGGSELGPKALVIASAAYGKKGKSVDFVSNVDPDDMARAFKGINLKKTIVVIVSKSGGTMETLTNEKLARSYFEKEGIDSKNHFVAVTGKGSPMDDPSRYLGCFYIWDFVGGRYSATSMVGGVALAFLLGIEGYEALLKGASTMDKHALSAPMEKNLPLISALLGIWNRNFLEMATCAIIPYSQALLRFPAHLQQCDMESNGKHIDRLGERVKFHTGPIIWGEPGTNGQHSFYQLIHQGTDIVPLEFVGFEKSQYAEDLDVDGTNSQQKLLSNLFAQAVALALGQKSDNPNKSFEGNRPSRMLLAKQLDPFHLGALLAYYEHKVAFQGFIWNINSFDQEGVQLGKKLAVRVIDEFKGKNNFVLGKAFINELKGL